MIPKFNKHSKNLVEKLKLKVGTKEFCIKSILGRNVTCQSLENLLEIEADDKTTELVCHDIHQLFYRMGRNSIIYILFEPVIKFFKLQYLFNRSVEKNLTEITKDALSNRKRIKKSSNLFLDRVIQMKENTSIANVKDVEIVAQMIATGVDTSTVTLGNVIMLLAMHPDVQEKCYKEVKAVCIDSSSDIDLQMISQMKYIFRTIKECLRLLPTVPAIAKKSQHDIEFSIKYNLMHII